MSEPLKNVFLSDMLETLTKGNGTNPVADKVINLPNYEKICELVHMISTCAESTI
jgi:hypothetical protein